MSRIAELMVMIEHYQTRLDNLRREYHDMLLNGYNLDLLGTKHAEIERLETSLSMLRSNLKKSEH